MDGRIGRLHCHYRVLGTRESAGVTLARLDRVARARVAEVLETALDQALGDDPTVYVLRHVEARLVLSLPPGQVDGELARRWGQRLAGAVVRHIAHDPDDGANLVRFADQADYVAHFVTDLLADRAWSRWFYGPFEALRPRGRVDALRTVLLEHRDHLPQILGHLHRLGALEALLAVLDEATLRLLWSRGLEAYVAPAPEAVRPLFAAAMRLVDHLALWAAPRPEGERLLRSYLATRPPWADWQDRLGLATAVFDALRFLAQGGYLRRLDDAAAQALHDRLDAALVDLDWLDTAWLRASLLDLLVRESPATRPDLPVRSARRGLSPRQRDLLADLMTLLRAGHVALDRQRPAAVANALRLYAQLVARSPHWATDAGVTGVLQRLLAAWAALARSPSPQQSLQRLRQGDVAGAVQALSPADREATVRDFEFLAGLGEPGLAVVETLIGDGEPAAAASVGVETGCAGVFLLLRAVLDARLPLLVAGTGDPSGLGTLLVALGLRWAGAAGAIDGQVDAGLCLLAGLEGPLALDELRQRWSATPPVDVARFQAALFRILAGQRLVRGTALRLHALPVGSEHMALVAGTESGDLWPLGRIVETAAEGVETLRAWLDVWQQATGRLPDLITCDATLAAVAEAPPLAGLDVVIVPEMGPDAAEPIPEPALVADHRKDQEALSAAWVALEANPLGIPEVDLAVGVTAVALLRVWARWLRQFAASSVPYLLEHFVRRPGRVHVDADRIRVEMAPRPLDVVLDMAGYTADLEQVPWLDRRRVQFRL